VAARNASVLLALVAASFATHASADTPRIAEIRIRGAEAYDRAAVLRIIRLKPGDTLWRDAAAAAQALETRYHVQGYPAARVSGSFDAATNVLALDVDEGRLVAVEVEGLAGKAQRHALQVLDLETGKVLKDRDVTRALRRLEKASDGALRSDADQPYTVERVAEGGRLTVHLRPVGTRVSITPGGPGTAELKNKVDGFAPWVGVEATVHDTATYNHANLYARGAYGFASKDPRFVLGARRPFGAGRRLTLGYEFHDLTDTDDVFRLLGFEEPPTLILPSSPTRDYYRRRGHEAYAFVRLFPGAHLGLSWRGDDFFSLPVVSSGRLFSKKDPRPNPAIDEGSMRSLIATVRWASRGELFETRRRERDSFLLRSLYGTRMEEGQELRAEATFEVASPDLGGDFSFRRFIGSVQGYRDVTSTHVVRARVLLGLTSGEVPLQRRFAVGGLGTLRGYELKAFSGDDAALATFEWLVRPPSPFPGLVAFYDGGTVWDRGQGRDWKSDVGAGVEWPAGRGLFFRGDLAFPLQKEPGDKSARFTWRIRLPI
jgi:surface antigen Omp85-like protein/surface antigen-like variable number repeat protein